MMKKHSIRAYYALAAALLISLGSMVSGCKDTAPDPGFVDFGSMRVMEFVQCTPIQIFYFAAGTKDTVNFTPSALTYGVSTPYATNFPTGRGAGQSYHFMAKLAGTSKILAETDITLTPGDKKTWIIFQPGADSIYSNNVLSDLQPSGTSNLMAYFRFVNVSPDNTPLSLRVGDPLNGMLIADAVPFKTFSPYVGIATSLDTTVTFFVTDPNGTIMGRLAGVSLAGGSYHTITWGGEKQDCRKADQISGNLVVDDTTRVHYYDDNGIGNDQLPVPSTLRFNIINALIPRTEAVVNFANYLPNGLGVVINNNTAYDFNHVQPFSTAPAPFITGGNVLNVVPRAIPLNSITYIKFVKPQGSSPSIADTILFRFYANTQVTKSDRLISIIVFDTTKKQNLSAAIPYDSSYGTVTLEVPDQPVPGKAVIMVINAACYPYKTGGLPPLNYSGAGSGKTLNTKKTDIITIDPGAVTFTGDVGTGANKTALIPANFTAEAGAIYEVIAVGRINDPRPEYTPRYMVVRVNPVQ